MTLSRVTNIRDYIVSTISDKIRSHLLVSNRLNGFIKELAVWRNKSITDEDLLYDAFNNAAITGQSGFVLNDIFDVSIDNPVSGDVLTKLGDFYVNRSVGSIRDEVKYELLLRHLQESISDGSSYSLDKVISIPITESIYRTSLITGFVTYNDGLLSLYSTDENINDQASSITITIPQYKASGGNVDIIIQSHNNKLGNPSVNINHDENSTDSNPIEFTIDGFVDIGISTRSSLITYQHSVNDTDIPNDFTTTRSDLIIALTNTSSLSNLDISGFVIMFS